jgi:hypothetical protein
MRIRSPPEDWTCPLLRHTSEFEQLCGLRPREHEDRAIARNFTESEENVFLFRFDINHVDGKGMLMKVGHDLLHSASSERVIHIDDDWLIRKLIAASVVLDDLGWNVKSVYVSQGDFGEGRRFLDANYPRKARLVCEDKYTALTAAKIDESMARNQGCSLSKQFGTNGLIATIAFSNIQTSSPNGLSRFDTKLSVKLIRWSEKFVADSIDNKAEHVGPLFNSGEAAKREHKYSTLEAVALWWLLQPAYGVRGLSVGLTAPGQRVRWPTALA